jgi:hypothetical protein
MKEFEQQSSKWKHSIEYWEFKIFEKFVHLREQADREPSRFDWELVVFICFVLIFSDMKVVERQSSKWNHSIEYWEFKIFDKFVHLREQADREPSRFDWEFVFFILFVLIFSDMKVFERQSSKWNHSIEYWEFKFVTISV